MEAVFKNYSHVNPYIGTDKCTGHSYHIVYDQIFGEHRRVPIKLLEIGVMSGASLLGWADYFTHPDTVITGIDITNEYMNVILSDGRINFLIKDGTKNDDKVSGTFNFIIDDGSHKYVDQLSSFVLYKDSLVQGGVYIIEDVQTIEWAELLCEFGRNIGFEAFVHDLRDVKNKPYDILVVLKRTRV
jgi:hypothetical protein